MAGHDSNESEEAARRDAAALLHPSHRVLMQRATGWQRFFTYLLDTILFYIFAIVNFFVLGIVLGYTGTESYFRDAFALPLVVLFTFGYYVPQEALMGQTPGKMLMGTRVVDANGGPITLRQALIRTACRFIPFEPISMLAVDEHGGRSGWHDLIARTAVISTRKPG